MKTLVFIVACIIVFFLVINFFCAYGQKDSNRRNSMYILEVCLFIAFLVTVFAYQLMST